MVPAPRQPDVSSYAGPDRRGLDRQTFEDSPQRPSSAAVVALAVLGGLVVVSLLLGAGPLDVATMLSVVSSLALVLAGALNLLRWRVLGWAPPALVGGALLLPGALLVPLGQLDSRAFIGAAAGVASTSTRLVVLAGFALLLWRATTVDEVDSGLRPLRETMLAGAGVLATSLLVILTHAAGWARPGDNSTWVALELHLATIALLLLVRLVTAPGMLLPSDVRALRIALACIALAALVRASGPWLGNGALVAAAVIQCVAAAVLLDRAGSSILAALNHHQGVARSMSHQLRDLDSTALLSRQRLHDVRGALAGVRAAVDALHAHRDELAADTAAELEDALLAELARIEILVRPAVAAAASSRPDPGVACRLDDVLLPLVVTYRERGLRLVWEPCGLSAAADRVPVATVVQNLLENALRHAPGAQVRVSVRQVLHTIALVVSDDGPGLPAGSHETVFAAGVRSCSTGGEGLGLAGSRRLARSVGGDLVALPTQRGACFLLQLPVVAGDLRTPSETLQP
jgi:signal transduction histidine kinase